jgi:hypothetical protein
LAKAMLRRRAQAWRNSALRSPGGADVKGVEESRS